VLYLVTIRPDGATVCDCEAGSHGRTCKHQRAVSAYMAYRSNPTHLRPAQTWTGAQGLLEAFA
jgi:hypothetical protein